VKPRSAGSFPDADFITLLFCLLRGAVCDRAVGQEEEGRSLAVSIQSAFNELGIFDAHTNLRLLEHAAGNSGYSPSQPVIQSAVPAG